MAPRWHRSKSESALAIAAILFPVYTLGKKYKYFKKMYNVTTESHPNIHTCSGSRVVCLRMLIRNEIGHNHQQEF